MDANQDDAGGKRFADEIKDFYLTTAFRELRAGRTKRLASAGEYLLSASPVDAWNKTSISAIAKSEHSAAKKNLRRM